MTDAAAAVAIVLAQKGDPSVLLIRRAECERDPWSGHWSFPGGRRDKADPDLLHTALRELAEECGILLPREHVETALPPRPARRRGGAPLMVAPFVFHVADRLPVVLDPREAVEEYWIPLCVLRDPQRHVLRPVPGLPRDMCFPSIELQGTPLWGFTYRLITDWLGLAPHESGFESAGKVLDFVLAQGLRLKEDWHERNGVRVAVVEGAIPAESVLERFAGPGRVALPVNLLEARPDRIRIAGLAFEEYCISGS